MPEPGTEEVLRAGALEVVPAHFVARVADDVLPLAPRELALLVALMRHEGRVCSRELLYEEVWGRALPDGERSVDVYVRKLRAKLEAVLPHWQFIHTHHGFGYRLSPRLRTRPIRPHGRTRGLGADNELRTRDKETL